MSTTATFDKLGNIYPEAIVDGILEAIRFTWPQDDDDCEGEYERAQDAQLSDAAEATVQEYVDRFVEMLKAIESPNKLVIERTEGWDTSDCLGNDIWFTTQGHGVGFWEGSDRWTGHWRECNEHCETHKLGEAYLGDDGFIHLA